MKLWLKTAIISASSAFLSSQIQAIDVAGTMGDVADKMGNVAGTMGDVAGNVAGKVGDVFGEGYQKVSGNASFDLYYYNQQDTQNSPPSIVPTLSLQPEFYKEFLDGDLGLNFVPFVRITEHGNARADYDIRELNLKYFKGDWTFKVGMDREFWGVTESSNKVDVLNQVDLAGTLGGIQKLGQPMAKVSFASDYGEFSAYWLPYFRTRTFPAQDSALGGLPGVDGDKNKVAFEGKRRRWHQDYAFRWNHTIGDIDVAFSWFDGVDRTPIVLPTLDKTTGKVIFNYMDRTTGAQLDPNTLELDPLTGAAIDPNVRTLPAEVIPGYVLKQQFGLELQYTKGSWIFKSEITAVNSFKQKAEIGGYITKKRDYQTFVGGVEYVIPGLFGSPADLTIFSEYLWDSRGNEAISLFQDDIFLAARLNFNDENGTDAVFSVIKDTTNNEALISIGAGRRIGDDWRIGLSGITFRGISKEKAEQALGIRQVDFIQFQIKRFF